MKAIFAATAGGLALLGAWRSAAAEVSFDCIPLAKAKALGGGGSAFVELTPEQWQFARALGRMAPTTPASLPPGDRAALVRRADGAALLVFLDGDQACEPLLLGPALVETIMQVGRGEIVHPGAGS